MIRSWLNPGPLWRVKSELVMGQPSALAARVSSAGPPRPEPVALPAEAGRPAQPYADDAGSPKLIRPAGVCQVITS